MGLVMSWDDDALEVVQLLLVQKCCYLSEGKPTAEKITDIKCDDSISTRQ